MKTKNIITLITAIIVLASCGSTRKALAQGQQVGQSETQTDTITVQQQSGNAQQATPDSQQPQINITKVSYVCDMDMKIGIGSDSYKLGGKVSMRQNEVVRLNLTYMGFIEVGIMEFTPDYALIVSRISHEYCKADYSLPVLKNNGITFDKIWTLSDAELRSTKAKGDNSLGKLVQNLINTNINGGKKVSVDIKFGEPNYKKAFDSTTELSSRYTQVLPEELMSKLMSAMK